MPGRQQFFLDVDSAALDLQRGHFELLGGAIDRLLHFEHVAQLEVLFASGVIHDVADSQLFGGQQLRQLAIVPDVVLSLDPFRVGIERRVERSARVAQFAKHEFDRLFGNLLVMTLVGVAVGFGIDVGQLGIVVQHLFKMRDAPEAVGAVAVEAAAGVIVNATRSHPVERVVQHLACRLVGMPLRFVLQKRQLGRHGELRPVGGFRAESEASIFGVEAIRQAFQDRVDPRVFKFDRFQADPRLRRGPHGIGQDPGVLFHFLAFVAPRLDDSFHQRGKPHPAVVVFGGEVRSASDRPGIGQ